VAIDEVVDLVLAVAAEPKFNTLNDSSNSIACASSDLISTVGRRPGHDGIGAEKTWRKQWKSAAGAMVGTNGAL